MFRLLTAIVSASGSIATAMIFEIFQLIGNLVVAFTRNRNKHSVTSIQNPPSPKNHQPPPVVNVTVNIPTNSGGHRQLTEAQSILNKRDASIYITFTSKQCWEHPHSAEINRVNDFIAMKKMQSNGDPFAPSPNLDTSMPAQQPLNIPVLTPDDSPLPVQYNKAHFPKQDGAIWLVRGSSFSEASSMPVAFPKLPALEPAPLALPFTVIPPPDGKTWLVRGSKILPIERPRV
jgi:hypothetical protein